MDSAAEKQRKRIGQNQRTARESIGLTRRELANLARVPVGVLTSSERGHYVLVGELHAKVLKVFNARGASAVAKISPEVSKRLTPAP